MNTEGISPSHLIYSQLVYSTVVSITRGSKNETSALWTKITRGVLLSSSYYYNKRKNGVIFTNIFRSRRA